MEVLCLLAVILPILVGCMMPWTSLGRNDQSRQGLLLASFAVNIILVILCCFQNGQFTVFEISKNLSMTFMLDGMGKFFALLVGVMWCLVGIYSFEYMTHEDNRPRFYAFYMATLGALNGICFAGNYMTLYCFFEFMTLLSMPMVLHNQSKEAIDAAKTYLLYSIFGASLGLAGFFFLSHYGTTTAFVAGGVLDMSKVAGNESLLLIIAFLTIVGFGAKAGMMPLHAWLPIAHPVAPACASSVLSGVITKAGVLAIIRVVFYQFGASFIAGTWVQYAWIILALITVLTGSMLAYKEKVLKKRLAYSTVSQVSYILFGLACLNPISFVGALLHVVAHSLIKNVLFMSAGSMIMHGHVYKTNELDGIGIKMPKTLGCFTVASLGLIGIPPLLGFVSKWYLASGSLSSLDNALSWIGPAVLLASALLTAGYLFSITISAFFVKKESHAKEAGMFMLVPMAIACILIFACGLFPHHLSEFINAIIQGLF